MFRCAITKKVSNPGEKPLRVVMETRIVSYVNYVTDEETRETRVVHSKGWEIVREITVSEEGYRVLTKTEGRMQ